jgi:hypothetical protein
MILGKIRKVTALGIMGNIMHIHINLNYRLLAT